MRSTITTITLSVLLAGCAVANEGLRSDIKHLDSEIAVEESDILSKTPVLSAQTDGLRAHASYRPIVSWSNAISHGPPIQRTVTFSQTGQSGYIKYNVTGCHPFGGNFGYYVEVAGGNPTTASVELQSISLEPAPSGLQISTPLHFEFGTMIHVHLYPAPPPLCVGGGAGTYIHVGANKDLNAVLSFALLPVTPDGRLPYEISLVSPVNTAVTLQIGLGKFGTLGQPIGIDNFARQLSTGSVNLLFLNSGVLGPLPNGKSYDYRINTVNPSVNTDTSGIVVSSQIATQVTPH